MNISKNYLILYTSVMAAFLLSCGAGAIDLNDVGGGARPIGMGKAFVAVADDANAIFSNPAGLATQKEWGVTSMTTKLLNDVDYQLLGLRMPSKLGMIGIGYVGASTGNITLTSSTGVTGASSYNNSVIDISYATRTFSRDLDLGANLKLFSEKFSGGLSAGSNGLNMDVGLLWRVTDWAKLGVVQSNILTPATGGKMVWTTGSEEAMPTTTRIGLAADFFGKHLKLSSEYETTGNLLRMGMEWFPLRFIGMRIGSESIYESGGTHSNLTYGLGLIVKDFTFDYAYYNSSVLSANSTHYFSIGWNPGVIDDLTLKPIVFSPTPTRKTSVEAGPRMNLKLASFSDVKTGQFAEKAIRYLGTLEILKGYPDGTFKPDEKLTRAEFVTMLVRAKTVEPTIKYTYFVDVPADNWASRFIQTAVGVGYVKGFPGQRFLPNKQITRAEAVTILCRFDNITPPTKAVDLPFTDLRFEFWGFNDIAGAKMAGLLDYLQTTQFMPNEPITRKEACELLFRTRYMRTKLAQLYEQYNVIE